MNVKQEPEWRKSFVLRAYVHNSKLKNAAIRMVFQYWVTFINTLLNTIDFCIFVEWCCLYSSKHELVNANHHNSDIKMNDSLQ